MPALCLFFFFNDTATTEIYTLSLHDALPISTRFPSRWAATFGSASARAETSSSASPPSTRIDRKSTRLNSSHLVISYAVFCLKKKNKRPSRRRLLTVYGLIDPHPVLVSGRCA